MALCTECGTVMHNDDMTTHICDPDLLPEKGKENKKTNNLK